MHDHPGNVSVQLTSVCMVAGLKGSHPEQSGGIGCGGDGKHDDMNIFHYISTAWSSVINKFCHAHWISKCCFFQAMTSCLELQESRNKVQSAFCSYAVMPLFWNVRGCPGIRDQANSGRGEANCSLWLIFADAHVLSFSSFPDMVSSPSLEDPDSLLCCAEEDNAGQHRHS